MKERFIAEFVVTSFLFLLRVWSRPTEIMCGVGRREGDKWFNGCRWCVCQHGGPVCSRAECSPFTTQLPPCHNVGSSWSDGCYLCKCGPSGIECAANHAYIQLITSQRFQADFMSPGTCLEDDRCVCGIDGVPSCTPEVIDQNSQPATTIKRLPIFHSSPTPTLQRSDISDKTFTHSEITNTKSQNPYSHSPNVGYDDGKSLKETFLETNSPNENQNTIHSGQLLNINYQHKTRKLWNTVDHKSNVGLSINSLSGQDYFSVTKETDRPTVHDEKEQYSTELPRTNIEKKVIGVLPANLNSENIEDRTIYKETAPLGKTFGSKVRIISWEEDFKEHLVTSYINVDEHNQKIQSYGDQSGATSENVLPSEVVVNANQCRWGSRWYNGSLRCYCGQNNSITCGDPSFVVTNIDGFMFRQSVCEEGDTFEDTNSCTVCECKIHSVAVCRRSPSCHLPFLNGLLAHHTDHVDRNSVTQNESTEKKEELFLDNKRNDKSVKDLGSGQNEVIYNLGGKIKIRDKIADISDTPDMDIGSGLIDETDSKIFLGSAEGSVDASSYTTHSFWHGKDGKQTEFSQESSTFTPQDNNTNPELTVTDSSKHSGPDNGTSTTMQKHTETPHIEKKSTTNPIECKPNSRWLSGCKSCKCDSEGKKQCNTIRCPKLSPGETPKPSDGSGYKHTVRPMQQPPTYPVYSATPSLDLCGKFKPGDRYWVDCNLCLCTEVGPKCTAKSC